jgi:hypothetical protein
MSASSPDENTIKQIDRLESRLGSFYNLKYGIELVLLRLFVSRLLHGPLPQDPDANSLLHHIYAASEYNDAEKLHLMLYVEELLGLSSIENITSIIESYNLNMMSKSVDSRLIRRFPRLSPD